MSKFWFCDSLRDTVIDECSYRWPSPSWDGWHRYSGEMGEKLASKPQFDLGTIHYKALVQIASSFQQQLPAGCFVDMSLHGAGLHWIRPGGRLPRHLDAERHPTNPWIRTHSAVCFLDSIKDGGELVLNDGRDVIQPHSGLVVAFETLHNWHWVNRTDVERRTIALFAWKKIADDHCVDGDKTTRATFREK